MIRTFVHDQGATLVHLAIGKVKREDIRLAVAGYTRMMPPNVLWDLSPGQFDMTPDEIAAEFARGVLPAADRAGGHLRAAVIVSSSLVQNAFRGALSDAETVMALGVFLDRERALAWLGGDRRSCDEDAASRPLNFDGLLGAMVDLDGDWIIARLESHGGEPVAVLSPASSSNAVCRRPLVDVMERLADPVELGLPEFS